LSLTAENLSTTAESFKNTAEDLSKTAEREQQNFENSVKKQSQDVTVLKDYAESTMNELLSKVHL
jgi:molecular chaperone GrpE (heat shock protein)